MCGTGVVEITISNKYIFNLFWSQLGDDFKIPFPNIVKKNSPDMKTGKR